jgi:hypothetical protein
MIKTPYGHVHPLDIHNGLAYIPIRPYTDKEWGTLPRVVWTSKDPWDPSMIDSDFSERRYLNLMTRPPRMNKEGRTKNPARETKQETPHNGNEQIITHNEREGNDYMITDTISNKVGTNSCPTDVPSLTAMKSDAPQDHIDPSSKTIPETLHNSGKKEDTSHHYVQFPEALALSKNETLTEVFNDWDKKVAIMVSECRKYFDHVDKGPGLQETGTLVTQDTRTSHEDEEYIEKSPDSTTPVDHVDKESGLQETGTLVTQDIHETHEDGEYIGKSPDSTTSIRRQEQTETAPKELYEAKDNPTIHGQGHGHPKTSPSEKHEAEDNPDAVSFKERDHGNTTPSEIHEAEDNPSTTFLQTTEYSRW